MPKVTKAKPSIKQIRAANLLVENGGNLADAMRKAGYSEATARTPQKLTESQGFQQLCDDLGLTDTFLVKSLKDDIDAKPQNRKPEMELAFKIKGRLNNSEGPQNNTFINWVMEAEEITIST